MCFLLDKESLKPQCSMVINDRHMYLDKSDFNITYGLPFSFLRFFFFLRMDRFAIDWIRHQ